MRYVNSLRNILQNRIYKQGLNANTASKLLKIYNFEGVFFHKNNMQNVKIADVTDAFLGAALIVSASKGIRIHTEICKEKEIKINLKMYEILLSNIVFSTKVGGRLHIKFSSSDNSVCITFFGDIVHTNFKKTAARMGGLCIKLLGNNKYSLLLPYENADNDPISYKNEIDLINDSFSVINLFALMLKDSPQP